MLKLHLGCFNKKIPGYVNVDARADVNPDLVADVSKLESIDKDSVDVIYTCHVLEHFSREDSIKTLQRWYDILRPGGTIRISVPDISAACEYYVKHRDLEPLKCLLFGSQKHPYDFHYTGYDFKTLERDLKLVGFKNIHIYDRWSTEHADIDDYSAAYLPHMDRQGLLMSLNVEGYK